MAAVLAGLSLSSGCIYRHGIVGIVGIILLEKMLHLYSWVILYLLCLVILDWLLHLLLEEMLRLSELGYCWLDLILLDGLILCRL